MPRVAPRAVAGCAKVHRRPRRDPHTLVTGALMPGKYEKLYRYLQDRFANVVVLTFAQVEDLLGFPLPALARADSAWWANPDPNDTPSSHARSWTLATRTATPNMRAQTVTFERPQH